MQVLVGIIIGIIVTIVGLAILGFKSPGTLSKLQADLKAGWDDTKKELEVVKAEVAAAKAELEKLKAKV